MEQYWYVIKEKKHFGPFVLKDLKKLHREKKISMDMSLWHPKWPSPVSCMDQQFSHWWVHEETIEISSPKVSLPAVLQKKNYTPAKTLKHLARLQKHEQNFHIAKPSRKKKIHFKWDQRITMIVCLLSISSLLYLGLKNNFMPVRPKIMAPSQYNQVKNFLDTENKNPFYASLSKDFKTLWLAQKVPGNVTFVELSANSNNLVSNVNYTKVWNKADVINSQLLNFNFDKNSLPPVGFYKLKIHWLESSFMGIEQNAKSLTMDFMIGGQSALQIKSLVKAFHHPTSTSKPVMVNKEQEILLETTTVATPEAKSQISNIKITTNINEDLKQKYQTLESIIADIKNNWVEIKSLESKKLHRAMKDFQNNYAKSTGSFLTALVLSNEQEIKNLSQNKKALNSKFISHLNNLTETAKKTGVLSAELMSNYTQLAKNPKKNDSWNQKLSSLEQDLLDKMNQL